MAHNRSERAAQPATDHKGLDSPVFVILFVLSLQHSLLEPPCEPVNVVTLVNDPHDALEGQATKVSSQPPIVTLANTI